MDYKPGTYVKGSQARNCETPADAVAAVFNGFKLASEAPAAPAEQAVEPVEAVSSVPIADPNAGPGEAGVDDQPDPASYHDVSTSAS